jgi:hypothetical protein
MPVGRFAKFAFAVPAALLVLGAYAVATEPACAHGPTAGGQGSSNPQCPTPPSNNISCGVTNSPGAPVLTECPSPVLGWTVLTAGIIAVPLAYLFYRSRFYTPIPP